MVAYLARIDRPRIGPGADATATGPDPEEGARLAAEAIWPHLRPSAEASYDDPG